MKALLINTKSKVFPNFPRSARFTARLAQDTELISLVIGGATLIEEAAVRPTRSPFVWSKTHRGSSLTLVHL